MSTIIENLIKHEVVFFSESCPVEATEDGTYTMFCPNGDVWHYGVKANDSMFISTKHGYVRAADLTSLAVSRGCDVILTNAATSIEPKGAAPVSITNLSQAVDVFKMTIENLSYGDIHMSIVEETPIPYGVQLRVEYQEDIAIANIYYGKKGAKYVYQGADNKALALLKRFFPIGA